MSLVAEFKDDVVLRSFKDTGVDVSVLEDEPVSVDSVGVSILEDKGTLGETLPVTIKSLVLLFGEFEGVGGCASPSEVVGAVGKVEAVVLLLDKGIMFTSIAITPVFGGPVNSTGSELDPRAACFTSPRIASTIVSAKGKVRKFNFNAAPSIQIPIRSPGWTVMLLFRASNSHTSLVTEVALCRTVTLPMGAKSVPPGFGLQKET